ncbi:(3R)-3-hydroxyacyl-CoA dehydrogenase-like [Dermacentor andersoni]|uniref:(3R)-3-hydroxyacyl-CoA dehydrogenase-like n=1 Tax=Dermacentor andersoni TaxID=34620 RepID=UPI002415F5CC|nr:(3R)-3-hydroxyacyl-CoA dehydrogenase-like [Dermacentor andersoni]
MTTVDAALYGRLALVTGGASGIGKAVCQLLAADGVTVVVADIQLEAAENVARALPGDAKHQAMYVDVGEPLSVEQLFNGIRGAFSEPLSIVVHCAGILRAAPLSQCTDKLFDEIIKIELKRHVAILQHFAVSDKSTDVQQLELRMSQGLGAKAEPPMVMTLRRLKITFGLMTYRRDYQSCFWCFQGTFLVNRAAIRDMLRSGKPLSDWRGAIVNVSSLAARCGSVQPCAYGAAKAGVQALTKSAASEVAKHGIRCNVVVPGWVDTPMMAEAGESNKTRVISNTPLKRTGQPMEVAEAIKFLCSPTTSSFITGTVLEVTGGFKM